MTFCGIPIFFQEVAIGQYLGSGGMTLVAQLCPLFKGKTSIIYSLISIGQNYNFYMFSMI